MQGGTVPADLEWRGLHYPAPPLWFPLLTPLVQDQETRRALFPGNPGVSPLGLHPGEIPELRVLSPDNK